MVKSKLIIFAIASSIMIATFTGCDDSTQTTESSSSSTTTSQEVDGASTTDAAVTAEDRTYTQEYVSEANLVSTDGYSIGAGTKDGILHYIFQVEKDGETSVDIDVAEVYCRVIDVNSKPEYKDKLDRVFAYERTYSDGTKHFYYEIYTVDAAIANLGELSTEQ